ncbi:MAG: ATP-binding protein [Deltaproteobacteria bacterium]|nr:ATP-binding protein [Deltaproteobacteria bacterium]
MENSLLNSLNYPVLTVDRQMKVRLANLAAGNFWRLSPAGLRGKSAQKLFGPGSKVAYLILQAIEGEVPATLDGWIFPQADGDSPLILHVQVDPLLVADQPVDQAVVSFWDQSQAEYLAAAGRDRQLSESIGVMVGRLAHELQNPLSGIKGATQLLARQVESDPETREYPTVILKELERLERLVKNLLQQGGEPPLSKSLFNLHELLDTVVWFVANGNPGVTISRLYDPTLPEILGDRDRLHQVFLNLIQNGVDACLPQGEVTVETRIMGNWQLDEKPHQPAPAYFLVEVKDNGPGVKPENIPRLFTPFFTTRKKGNGLGLSLSNLIVRSHHGFIRHTSPKAGGTVFLVYLPHQEKPE